jgi:ATP-dependent Lon protease
MSTTLPVLFLDDAVVLPGMVLPIELTSQAQASIDAARAARGGGRSTDLRDLNRDTNGDTHREPLRLLLVPRIEGRTGVLGTVAEVTQIGRLPSGEPAAVLRATGRARIGTGVSGPGAALWVEADILDVPVPTGRARELAADYKQVLTSILQQRQAYQVIDAVQRMTDPSELADAAGYAAWIETADKLRLLETVDVAERLEFLLERARAYLAEMEVSEKIASDVREGMEKSQREYLLRQQLAAIRKELGELSGDGETDAGSDYRTRIEKADLPEAVRTAALREADRLERTSDQSPESGWIRTWLDTVLELPWTTRTTDTTDVAAARSVLDADHTGLDDVKDRIVEYLAVRARRAQRGLEVVGGRGSGAVLALVGPPGVGKTSLGESVARALGRSFVDPAQNHTFRDHYLELDLDLSDVVFLATANVAEAIPDALLDRMELVRLDGYTEEEKVAIARDHLLPRQLERAGLTADEVVITEAALGAVAGEHTHEAGVRQLERAIARILRKVAAQLAAGTAETPVTVDVRDLRTYLGRARFTPESADRTAVPGVATGLAVTGAGGDVLFVEVATMEGEPGLTLTGQLGDVMKESAQIALSYLRANGDRLGVPAPALGSLSKERVHVHFPAGAVPKDGPSAGVTMTTALASLLTGRLVKANVGMTGEVSLTGRVLPIGGVKQKLLAAHRAGLTEVILPERNGPDLDDVPEQVREQLTVHLVSDVGEVLELALEPTAPAAASEPAAAAA